MSLLRFGGGRMLSVNIGVPSGLHKGAGLHRLTFPLLVDARSSMSGGVLVGLSGEVWLGAGGGDWLGQVSSVTPVVTDENGPFDATLVLALTDDQLAVIEQRRAGSDLQLRIDLWVTLGFDPQFADGDVEARWPSRTVQEQIDIQSGAWVRLLAQSNAGTSLAVVVPVPLHRDARAMSIGAHLREAIRKVNAGEYADAVVAARRGLDVIDEAWPSARAVVQVPQRERSLDERLGLLREGLNSLAGTAPHGDAVSASIRWDRENALAVIAGVAALAACVP